MYSHSINIQPVARIRKGEHWASIECDSYEEAIKVLRSKVYDIALLDLLMPPESFMLGSDAFGRVAGSDFPAGIFLALIAARAGVKDIVVVTDASHHAHPATALLDFAPWGKPLECGKGSMITFQQARTAEIPGAAQRVKDWSHSLSAAFAARAG